MALTQNLPSELAPAEVDARVAEWVRMFLSRRGLKQAALTSVIGVSVAGVSGRMNGHIPWRARELAAMAQFFGFGDPGIFYKDPDDVLRSR